VQCGAVPYSKSTVHIMMFDVNKKIVENGSIFDPFLKLSFLYNRVGARVRAPSKLYLPKDSLENAL
jgi:hypothetical protein